MKLNSFLWWAGHLIDSTLLTGSYHVTHTPSFLQLSHKKQTAIYPNVYQFILEFV